MFKVGDIVCCEPNKLKQKQHDHYQIIKCDPTSLVVTVILHSNYRSRRGDPIRNLGQNLGEHHSNMFYKVAPNYSRNLPEWW
jgi:hypothetical protein